MLNDMLRGMTPDDARQAEWRRGTLPPGQLGWRKAGELREQSTLLATTASGIARPTRTPTTSTSTWAQAAG